VAGDTLNSNAALGLAHGKSSDNSATWARCFKQQVERCWKKPYGGIESQKPEAAFAIRLKRDGTLEGMPGAGRIAGDAVSSRLSGERVGARSSNASRIISRQHFSRSGNIFAPGVHRTKDLKLFVIWSSLPGNHGYEAKSKR